MILRISALVKSSCKREKNKSVTAINRKGKKPFRFLCILVYITFCIPKYDIILRDHFWSKVKIDKIKARTFVKRYLFFVLRGKLNSTVDEDCTVCGNCECVMYGMDEFLLMEGSKWIS